jgi:DNA-directed RNA polymerase
MDKREQKRKIKANLIHMLDATWNLLTCRLYNSDIAAIHDCHGIHSCDIDHYNFTIRRVLANLFLLSNQYYNLLEDMLEEYKKQTNDVEFYNIYKEKIKKYYKNIIQKYKLNRLKNATYLFIPK